MSNALVISVHPTEEPIELAEAKAHLRVEVDDDDALIEGMIKASREYCENVTHRALITQTWKLYLDEWPVDESYIELPMPPLQSVTAVNYTDYLGTVSTMSTSDYTWDTAKEPGRLVLAYGESWPTDTLNVTSPICITYTAGYGTPDDLPESLKLGMKADLSDLYDQRQAWVQGSWTHLPVIDRLYYPYRVFSL